jgi:hypothetical protein
MADSVASRFEGFRDEEVEVRPLGWIYVSGRQANLVRVSTSPSAGDPRPDRPLVWRGRLMGVGSAFFQLSEERQAFSVQSPDYYSRGWDGEPPTLTPGETLSVPQREALEDAVSDALTLWYTTHVGGHCMRLARRCELARAFVNAYDRVHANRRGLAAAEASAVAAHARYVAAFHEPPPGLIFHVPTKPAD